jgi:hypothetical protein
MKLNVLERITLLQVLPREGSYITFKILMDLKAKLAFNEKEIKDCGIDEKEGRVTWKKSMDKEIEIGEKAFDIVQETLKKIDKEGKINEQTFILFEKFIKS